MKRRTMALVAMSTTAVLGVANTAYAHECFIANRSAQGNAGCPFGELDHGHRGGLRQQPGFPAGCRS